MTEEKKLTPAEWGNPAKGGVGKRRRLLGVPGAMKLSGIPMNKPITQGEFERAMNKWRKKPAHRLTQPAPPPKAEKKAAASPHSAGSAGDLSVVEITEEKKGGKK